MKRAITQIHEIELSSRCNLACVYCPNPTMKRSKMDMEWETYERALEHVEYFCRRGTQGELALTGVGEALLHERFAEAVLLARDVIGRDRSLTFSTNGILLTDELLDKIEVADPTIFISLHRPEVAALAVERVKKRTRGPLCYGVNAAFVHSSLNWAGQVNWHVSHIKQTCTYLRDGWAVVRADGGVGTCCWDAESESGHIGTVWDEFGTFVTAPHEACKKCSLVIPSYESRGIVA